MHALDWLIMAVPLLVCMGIVLYTRRFVRSVADFMAGGRNAGRFLLSTAKSQQSAGAVGYVATFQIFLVAGFTLTWWSQMSVPVNMLIAISGFVIYRYRQTRAMTLGQFFEMRYSRNFRLFTGIVGFFAGLVNFGIIPVIGARFMVYLLELPPELHPFGWTIPTYLVLMAIFLTITALMTTGGGQITVLITDCIEGMYSQCVYTFVAIALLIMFFKWSSTRDVLLAAPAGASMVNPFDTQNAKDFNIWLIIMMTIGGCYKIMAWQNSHAFNSSAATPHESVMGNIMGQWRAFALTAMVTLLSVCAVSYLKSAEGAQVVQAALSKIPDASIRSQMQIPVALSHLLPVGIKGALVSIVLLGVIAGDGIHLHSWSSIFVQDVLVPLRKKPMPVNTHLTVLRVAIVGVAVWAFLFGWLFPQVDYVALWFQSTEAIYTGGAGAAIIGGLYWSRGTTAAAWVAMITGSVLCTGGIITQSVYTKTTGHEFPLNGMQISFFSSIIAVTLYVVISLLTSRQPFNMDKLLHRGAYKIESDTTPAVTTVRKGFSLYRFLGIDEQFTRTDRWITLGIFYWGMIWVVAFAVGSVVYLGGKYYNHGTPPWSDAGWAGYWLVVSIYLPVFIGALTTIWFTIGCTHDMRIFFRRLREERVNIHDDGTVSHGQFAEDLTLPESQAAIAGPNATSARTAVSDSPSPR